MTNGCICCTLREDLWLQINDLADTGSFDYLLIESSGISEPLPVAATFSFVDARGHTLKEKVRLDTMVTVVDASNFLGHYMTEAELKDLPGESLQDDERCLSDLLVDQVEFADVLLLNKLDLVSAQQAEELRELLKRLNPRARLLPVQWSRVDLGEVLNTGRFDPNDAEQAQGWTAELRALSNPDHSPETEEYGICSFVYRARRPFHPERLWKAVQTAMEGILRVKGFFWLATHNQELGYWSQAGGSLRLEAKGRWWAAIPRDEWPAGMVGDAWLASRWQEPWGDRRQELVVIGQQPGLSQVVSVSGSGVISRDGPIEHGFAVCRPQRSRRA